MVFTMFALWLGHLANAMPNCALSRTNMFRNFNVTLRGTTEIKRIQKQFKNLP